MANPTWGLLQKSQTDSTTIETRVDEKIAVHEADEESHLGVGESLQSHKAAEIIDHLASSIIEDKIRDGNVSLQKLTAENRIIISAFESLDGWVTDGNVIGEFGSVTFYTSAVSDNHAGMVAVPASISGLVWTKDFFWQSTVKILYTTNVVIYFGIGGSPIWGYFSGAGFKFLNGTLYCYTLSLAGGSVIHEITGIDVTDPHVYRVFYDYSATTLAFYIDGVLKHTFTSGLPTEDDDNITVYSLKTLEDSAKYMYAFDLLISIPK